MVVGVARPHATVSVPREEATVVLAMDISRSMTATDMKPTRLASAKAAARAFMEKVPDKFRIGLVTFADRAVVSVPPTADRSVVDEGLDAVKPGRRHGARRRGRAGRPDRAGGSAPPTASLPPTAVLLISDGSRDGGRTTPAGCRAKRARTLHVPVYTIALGTPDGVVQATLTGGYKVR